MYSAESGSKSGDEGELSYGYGDEWQQYVSYSDPESESSDSKTKSGDEVQELTHAQKHVQALERAWE